MAAGRPRRFIQEIRSRRAGSPCDVKTVCCLTKVNARRQSFQVLKRHSQNHRSAFCSRGPGHRRLNTVSCWRRGQVLLSNFPNTAGQDDKANRRRKQRKQEVRREGQRGGEVNYFRWDGVLARLIRPYLKPVTGEINSSLSFRRIPIVALGEAASRCVQAVACGVQFAHQRGGVRVLLGFESDAADREISGEVSEKSPEPGRREISVVTSSSFTKIPDHILLKHAFRPQIARKSRKSHIADRVLRRTASPQWGRRAHP
jgi:hypothetical protein